MSEVWSNTLYVCVVCKFIGAVVFINHYLPFNFKYNIKQRSLFHSLQWHHHTPEIIFKKKLYLWLFNKTHYQIDEIIRITRITFTMMKQV